MSSDYYPISWLNTASLIVPGIVICALLLDRILGEPSRWHPLAGFGNLANWLEKQLNHAQHPLINKLMGLGAWFLLLSPFIAFSLYLSQLKSSWIADCLLLYFAIGARSLEQHAMRIYHGLTSKDLAKARLAVSMIVSRDTQNLDENEIAAATVESVLENGNDAIFGAIFWFIVFGGTGALAFRLANTLDAMWGYRTPRFVNFGWASARLDDLFNLIPARLTALSYALCGHTGQALHCWRTQASNWYSPNAGPVMSAGAGALNVQLGGAAPYHGKVKIRPLLGVGESVAPKHILLAVRLLKRSVILWCLLITLIYLAAGYIGGSHA